MTEPWGHMGCFHDRERQKRNKQQHPQRAPRVCVQGGLLILCAGILAMVLFSGTHETRTADQCGQGDARAACQAPSTPYPAYPAKGGVAPFGAGAVDRHAGN